MEIETTSSIAALSNQWTRVLHLSFDSSKIRPSFAEWVENPESNKTRSDGVVMLFAYLRKVARLNKIWFPVFSFVYREERGRNGRYHIHALTGGWILPSVMSDHWKWGRSSVQEYRPSGNIADYICKCLGAEIEHARFSGRADLAVTFSENCIRKTVLTRMRRQLQAERMDQAASTS